MPEGCGWLPSLCLLLDFDGDWHRYEDELYRHFRRDFIVSRPSFQGRQVGYNVAPVVNGKEESFWHLITEEQETVVEGVIGKERLPHLQRCERIRWPRPIIDAAKQDCVLVWREQHQGGQRIVLTTDDFSYFVAIAVRGPKLFLATAFPVEQPGRRERFEKQYGRAQREGRSL
jgi:hypothetical protein